ncbi:MAG: pyridoxal-phosphate dependent enzyme [Proteobacteria bacterium]|jgi:threonine dehydratase|nr:pyridoxal-phosphate dependent enzyme [Pseudomonadota bacterium]MDA1352021.1 pyridoxal-phosphate dependent enzyme [Pseudomonadota bacterium]|tara:strand:- start:414 stop:1364 length:951 start_codon:yes stop_codon:yes gene_type:complete
MTVTLGDIKKAHQRIKPYIHCTPILQSTQLNKLFTCELFFKADNMQKVGAFKARGACNAVFSMTKEVLANGVITHSSGNHGAALAWAAAMRNIPCTVVMPENAPQAKKDAVLSYGAIVVYCEPTMLAREGTVARLIEQQGARLVHPYDDDLIIAGQGTATLETLAQLDKPADILMTPVGGGGLLGGSAIVVKQSSRTGITQVIGAEPEAANDAWLGFRSGTRLTEFVPNTIADGLRGTVGVRNFEIITQYVDDILLSSEARIVEAMKLIWTRLKVVVEPSAAVPLAAIMDQPEQFKGKRVAIILSGGNLDLDALPW